MSSRGRRTSLAATGAFVMFVATVFFGYCRRVSGLRVPRTCVQVVSPTLGAVPVNQSSAGRDPFFRTTGLVVRKKGSRPAELRTPRNPIKGCWSCCWLDVSLC